MSKYNHLSFLNKAVFSPKEHKQANKKLNYLETLIFSTINFFSALLQLYLFSLGISCHKETIITGLQVLEWTLRDH